MASISPTKPDKELDLTKLYQSMVVADTLVKWSKWVVMGIVGLTIFVTQQTWIASQDRTMIQQLSISNDKITQQIEDDNVRLAKDDELLSSQSALLDIQSKRLDDMDGWIRNHGGK